MLGPFDIINVNISVISITKLEGKEKKKKGHWHVGLHGPLTSVLEPLD